MKTLLSKPRTSLHLENKIKKTCSIGSLRYRQQALRVLSKTQHPHSPVKEKIFLSKSKHLAENGSTINDKPCSFRVAWDRMVGEL
jgi:hypothetical protein